MKLSQVVQNERLLKLKDAVLKYYGRIKEWILSQIEPLSFSQRLVAAVLSLGLPLFFYFYWYVKPTSQKIRRLEVEIAKIEKELRDSERLRLKSMELERKLKRRKEFLKTLVSILPTTKEIPSLLKDVSKSAKLSGLEVISFVPKAEKERNFYNVIPFEMNLRGGFEELVSFLDKVEGLPRIITLRNITVEPDVKSVEGEVLFARCLFNTYRYTGKQLKPEKKKKRR